MGTPVQGTRGVPIILSIANGASQSDVGYLNGGLITGFHVPASFEGGYLTFQRSYDGVAFDTVYQQAGGIKVVSATSGTFVELDSPAAWLGCLAFKVTSTDSAGVATNQTGATSIVAIVSP